jgi:hypothetical protein
LRSGNGVPSREKADDGRQRTDDREKRRLSLTRFARAPEITEIFYDET